MKIQYVEYVQSVILYISSPISLALPPPPLPIGLGSEPVALYISKNYLRTQTLKVFEGDKGR